VDVVDPRRLRLGALSLLSQVERSRVAADAGLERLFGVLDRCLPDSFPSEEEAAETARCSRATFKRRLHRAIGTSYRDLRSRLLMRVAARTLEDPAVPIKSAANALGYGSSRAFDRAFGRWYGATPGAFRRRSGVAESRTLDGPIDAGADRSVDGMDRGAPSA
jgi:AraC-like DNA-binding protein